MNAHDRSSHEQEPRSFHTDALGERELEHRLTRIETQQAEFAKKEDLQKAKLWFVSSVAGGLFGFISLLLVLIRLFFLPK